MAEYYVYIMSNKSRMLYVGVTNNIARRVLEHKMKLLPGFTKKFNMTRFVYCESTNNAIAAIEREKQIKGWLRRKKTALIHSLNPEWKDLSEDFLPPNSDILHCVQDDKSKEDDHHA
jgi:putative endonuclease